MPRKCAVPYCNSGSRTASCKISVFRAPKDVSMRKTWEETIPGISALQQNDVVCEKHFDANDISREWVKQDSSGQIIARVPYKHPHLNDGAIPKNFCVIKREKENCDPLHNYATKDTPALVMKNPWSDSHNDDKSAAPFDIDETSDQETFIEEFSAPKEVACIVAPDPDHFSLPQPVEETSDRLRTDSSTTAKAAEVSLPHGSSQYIPDSVSTLTDSCALPESWSVVKMPSENGDQFLFSHVIMRLENGVSCPIMQQCVKLDGDGALDYYVYGRHINLKGTPLERRLEKKNEKLPNVLEKFKRMNMCNGLGKINGHVAREEGAFQDYVGEWRSHNCALISKKKRCDSCIKLRKRIEQRAARLSKRPMLSRIRNASNPVDQMKLSIMRIKNRRRRQQKLRVKKTMQNLMIRLQEQREQIAIIQDVTLDKKCVELNVPEAQKLSLKKIIAAANKKSTKGRRYTQEWIMLCMLMNIRSPGYYDFLRKNNILPLPCKRTIRGYFSLINTKCGFDEKFVVKKKLAKLTNQ